MSYKTEKTRLDRVFSLFIRLRDSNNEGVGRCYTCRNLLSIRRGECGHYKKRQLTPLRYDEVNNNMQCTNCNNWFQGRDDLYREYLINEHGEDAVNRLDMKASQANRGQVKFYEFELIEMQQRFLDKVMNLLEQKTRDIREWSTQRLKIYLGIKNFNKMKETK